VSTLPGLSPPRLGDRSLFPDLEARAYLAHAAVSPPSLAVRRAVIAHLNDLGRRGANYFGDALAQRNRLRALLGVLLGAPSESVALVSNTSLGVSLVALSIPWEPGQRVLCFEGEFPANVTPWQRAADLFGLTVVWGKADTFRTDPDAAWAHLDRCLAEGVRVVAVSAVQFQTGHRMPLAALAQRCHAHGAELFVDAIQGAGATPLDVTAEGIDYLAAGGHKWLMGLEGAGVVTVRPEAAARMRPHAAGWLSHSDPFEFLIAGAGHLRYDRPFVETARLLETGTAPAAGYIALEASVAMLLELGVDAIHAHVNAYLDPLESALVARGFVSLRSPERAGRSCVLGVVPPVGGMDAPGWQRALAARGVVTSCPDGVLRFAPHWPNNADRELDGVIAALDAVAAEA